MATTTYENVRSIGVMHRIGMRVEQNPCADHPWPTSRREAFTVT